MLRILASAGCVIHYKIRRKIIKKGIRFFTTKCYNFITKMQQLLRNMICDSHYKLRCDLYYKIFLYGSLKNEGKIIKEHQTIKLRLMIYLLKNQFINMNININNEHFNIFKYQKSGSFCFLLIINQEFSRE